jgi:hypothetical protein
LIARARERAIPIVYIWVAFRASFVGAMPEKPMIEERNMMRETEHVLRELGATSMIVTGISA